MSSTKSQVAVATNIQNHTTPSSSASTSSAAPSTAAIHSQRDYNNEDSLGRQSSFGNNRRGNPKGKHLTRSHAMRESTSPPRTPTPRAENAQHVSPNGHSSSYQQQQQQQQHQSHHHSHHHHHSQQQHHQQQQMYAADGNENYGHNNNNNNKTNNNNSSKLHTQAHNTRGNSPIIEAPSVIITSQQQQQQQQPQQNVPLSNEAEFPKLTPPKSTKSGGNGGNNNINGANNQRAASGINSNSSGSNDTNGKAESNNNNCNGIAKKLVSDFKYVNNSNSNGNGAQAGGEVGVGTATEVSKNSNHKQTQQHSTIAENSNNVRCQMQATSTAPYNSAMNYNAPSTSDAHQTANYEKDQRNSRQDSHNSLNTPHEDDPQHRHYQQQSQQHHQQQQQHYYERERSGGGGGGNKKHRASSSSKGPKPRLKNMGSSGGSVEGGNSSSSLSNNSSGFISRENSGEYTDNGGTDLITFFRETLNNKNIKDRHLLLKIEKELIELVQDKTRSELRFPSASSYNRMLIHRTAAYFGMEHNVDAETQQCVIVAATKGTRIPDIRFKSLVRDSREDSRKSILKRDTHSFDEARQSSYLYPDRGGMLDRKAKSFEEREEDYERARSRIFNRSQHDPNAGACGGGGGGGSGGGDRDEHYMSWTTSMEQQQQQQQQQHHHSQQQQSSSNRGRSSGKMIKMQTSTERERGSAGAVPKAHNYGCYSGPGPSQNCGNNVTGGIGSGNNGPPLLRGDSGGSNKSSANGSRNYNKQDFASGTNSWRLSPSNNGCKNCVLSASINLDSLSPTPTADHCSHTQTPEPTQFLTCCQPPLLATAEAEINHLMDDDIDVRSQIFDGFLPPPPTQFPPFGLVWAVTDILNVPKGSILINPQTLRPIVNQDGSIYHFDPSHLPPNAGGNGNHSSSAYHSNQAAVHQQGPNQDFYAKKSVNPNAVAQQNQQEHQIPQPLSLPQQHQSDVSTTISNYNTTANQTSPAETDLMGTNSLPLKIADEADESQDSSSFKSNEPATGDAISDEETPTQSGADECDNTAAGCLSITTTTSTKNYDRIEVQKFKNQATSPNIPSEKGESVARENSLPPEPLAQPECSSSSRNQLQNVSQTPTTSTQTQSQEQPPPLQQLQQSETPQSSRSTPYSGNDSQTKRASEEPRQQAWAYTQSYQAADGSTVFQTTNTPSGNPYCTTTYQQGPDGSVYAIPQGMVYAYPQQDAEVQGYFMPVYDTGAAAAATASLVPTGTQAVFPSAPAGATTMVPMATAYPTTQFATANGAPIFQGQVIYPSEQQQIPMTTYPTISYPYPYNGYWGQTMTYYVPTQQAALANAIPAAHLLTTPPQGAAPPPGANGTALSTAQHIAGGVNLASGILATPAASAPSMNSSIGVNGGAANMTALTPIASGSGNGNTFHLHGGTAYGTGRIKRPTPPHYSVQQTGGPHVMAGVPAIQQFAQAALSTLTLAPSNAAANATTTELNSTGANAPTGTAMYAVPQHATIYSANIYPYAASAATAGVNATAPVNTAPPSGVLTSAGSAGATAFTAQQTNSFVTPYYAAHRPQLHSHAVPVAPMTNTAHAPGPAAIPIVDPATLNNISSSSNSTRASSNNSNSGASHSAPPTPLSQSSQVTPRNPPLFSTPPIMSSASYSVSSTPHYFTTSGFTEQPTGSLLANTPQSVYVATSSYEKRSGKKSTAYASGSGNGSGSSGNSNRQNSNNATYANKPPTYGSNNENRSSPNNNARSHNKGKGISNHVAEKSQAPLLSAPPGSYMQSNAGGLITTHSYNPHYTAENSSTNGKPPIRLNAAAASFRQKSSGIEFRRSLSLSQRNSPGTTNSSSNDNSSNNSPSSVSNVAPIYATTSFAAAATSYGNNNNNNGHSSLPANGNNLEQLQQYQHSHQTTSPSVFIATAAPRSSHIPGPQAQMQHSGGPLATTLSGSTNAAVVAGSHAPTLTVLSSAATAVEVATAASTAHHHHQPLLGTYNPGAAATATGVYFKYGQTYLAHPTVSLPNSRRSPSTDLRPPMAQMTGMYPAVNMTMIPAPPRHSQGGRHPNPNYKGSRPR